jgi:2-polyprenyl-3-methyl-5-hydroxy-6-metoxy-1,4-benzoquinol methylase
MAEVHVARCRECGVYLRYPYVDTRRLSSIANQKDARAFWDKWYDETVGRNHDNFTNMVRFALRDAPRDAALDVLDYGGGGGQFALVVRSLFPRSSVWITDIADAALLPQWAELQTQIPFNSFPNDATQFDAIFLNDVFEHLENPRETLGLLAGKLKPKGIIFIDTPKTFWLYPTLKRLAPPLYRKLCIGTVSPWHLQVWSPESFDRVASQAGLRIAQYQTCSEFTQSPSYYMKNMGITNPAIRAAGFAFTALAPWIARNKIIATLTRASG